MHVVHYMQSEFLLPWRLRRQAELPLFILLIPYAVVRGVIPSRAALNETLCTGRAGGGMGTGVYWEPFELAVEECNAVVAEWKTRNAQHLLYPSGAGDFIEDAEILAVESHLAYLKLSREKYSTYRPPSMPKRSLPNILRGFMFTTGFFLIIAGIPVGFILGWQTQHLAHTSRVEAVIVGGIMAVTSILLGGLLFGLAVLITTAFGAQRRKHSLTDIVPE